MLIGKYSTMQRENYSRKDNAKTVLFAILHKADLKHLSRYVTLYPSISKMHMSTQNMLM